MFDELETLELQHVLRDCTVKMAELPERLKAQFMAAVQEGRKPYLIQPLSAIRAELVVKAIEAIGEVPHQTVGVMSLKEICRSQKRSCGDLAGHTVALMSDQLAAILKAAGIKEPDAQV